MTTPGNGESAPEVDLTKSDPAADAPFDPYRFGKPDHPVPPEYAPPGYVPPVPEVSPTSPYGPSSPYGPPPYGQQPYGQQPYGTPPPYGQQPYGTPPPYPGQYPPPYGAAPPPGHPGYVQPRTGNGKATAALVLGILSIVCFWLSIFDGVLIILALVFGILALNESKSRGGSGRGMAIAGLICMGVGAIAATVVTVVYVHTANKCGGLSHPEVTTSQFNQCVKDHL